MTAVNRGSKQNVNLLLARGAKIDCDWTKGMSLIADAMNFNDTGKPSDHFPPREKRFELSVELIAALLNNGAQVTPTADMLSSGQDQSSFYLLHYAVDDGLLDVAKLLIERGKAPLNVLDQSGWSPLHLAAGHNNIDLLTMLVEKGADVNIKVGLRFLLGSESSLLLRIRKATPRWHGLKRWMRPMQCAN